MTTSLQGKVVLITGGAKNLGGAIARRIGADGARVVVHYNSGHTKPEAEETVAAVRDAGGEAFAFQADLTNVAEIERLFAETLQTYGSLYGTVNTAGSVFNGPVTEATEDAYDSVFAVNTKAAYFVMRQAARHTEDGGRIIGTLTSLVAAYTAGYSVYAGSKGANDHFVRALSKELQGRDISVNNIAPGPMDTSFFWDAAAEGEPEFVRSAAKGGRLTRVEDIVPWVRFLLTEGAWASGQTFLVNGGFSTR